ncbi:hypothetical protein S83_039296 [Arachis hypogaea]
MTAEEKDCHGMPLHLAAFFVFTASSLTRCCVSFRVPFRQTAPRRVLVFVASSSSTCYCVPSAFSLSWQHLAMGFLPPWQRRKRRRRSIPAAMAKKTAGNVAGALYHY